MCRLSTRGSHRLLAAAVINTKCDNVAARLVSGASSGSRSTLKDVHSYTTSEAEARPQRNMGIEGCSRYRKRCLATRFAKKSADPAISSPSARRTESPEVLFPQNPQSLFRAYSPNILKASSPKKPRSLDLQNPSRAYKAFELRTESCLAQGSPKQNTGGPKKGRSEEARVRGFRALGFGALGL